MPALKKFFLTVFVFLIIISGFDSLAVSALTIAPKGLYFLEITSPRDSPFGSYKRYHDFHRINGTYFIQA